MKAALTFLAFGVLAWALWRLLNRQEAGDADFQRRLQADDRRARANRASAARDAPTPPEPPPAS